MDCDCSTHATDDKHLKHVVINVKGMRCISYGSSCNRGSSCGLQLCDLRRGTRKPSRSKGRDISWLGERSIYQLLKQDPVKTVTVRRGELRVSRKLILHSATRSFDTDGRLLTSHLTSQPSAYALPWDPDIWRRKKSALLRCQVSTASVKITENSIAV